MSDVSFQEETQYQTASSAVTAKSKGLNGLVIKMGLAKDGKGAERMLIVIAILVALTAVGLFMFGGARNNPPERPAVPNPGNLTP